MRIFIVEDDSVIAAKIKKHLEDWGYTTMIAQDFQRILPEIIAFDPQLVLMDISLPFYNGYYWCGEIRKVSKVPIIFVSSAADNLNIVHAVDMGGDDYITKPFDFQILMAKIQAMLRRTYDFGNDSNLLEQGGLIFNLRNATITYAGQKQELTKNEACILQSLMENAGKTVKREDMMLRLWETKCFVDDSALYMTINRLRKKLEQLGLTAYITTKKGTGYLIGE